MAQAKPDHKARHQACPQGLIVTIRWERFAGDTSTFALRMAFAVDPHGERGATPELAESWGHFQMWVEGVNLCAHTDAGETLEATHWYLLPLLEWLAAEWTALFHEERMPSPGRSDEAAMQPGPWEGMVQWADLEKQGALARNRWEWTQRHALRAARDGGLFPNIFMRRYRDRVEVSWADLPTAGAEDIRHLAPLGRARLPVRPVAEAMHAVALEAARWLERRSPQSMRLKGLVQRLQGLASVKPEEQLAWMAGLDGADKPDRLRRWRRIREELDGWKPEAVHATFGSPADAPGLVLTGTYAAGLLFGSTSPTLDDRDVITLSKVLLEQYVPVARPTRLDDLARGEPLTTMGTAWDQGYDLAGEVYEEVVDGTANGFVHIERSMERLGIALTETHLGDPATRAVSFAGPNHLATVAVNASSSYAGIKAAERFTLAHELCHLLFDRAYGAILAIASGPWAPRDLERRANAFAAMLLMPPDLIRQTEARIGLAVHTADGSRAVADILQVSHAVLVRHLENIGMIDSTTRIRLRPDL